MADYPDTVNALRTRLTAFTALPHYWPNDDREPTPADAPNGFVVSETRVLVSGRILLGSTPLNYRDRGELVAYVYVPAGTRAGTAEAHAQAIRALFTTDAVAGVIVTSTRVDAGQFVNGPAGRVWAVPVIIEWYTDRTE